MLDRIADMRAIIRRAAWDGREHYFAIVYAGIAPTEEQQKAHTRDHLIYCPQPTGEPPAFNKDGDSRVEALITLSNILGLAAPQEVELELVLR